MADQTYDHRYKRGIRALKSGVSSGDPVVVLGFNGVSEVNTDSNGAIVFDTQGAYPLSVKGVDDNGNVAVLNGDKLYYSDSDTPKITKKSSGVLFGTAYSRDVAHGVSLIGAGSTATITVALIERSGEPMGGTVEEFTNTPITALKGGGATSGTDTDVNVMTMGGATFEYVNIGTQTILAPVLTADGLNVARDQTDNDGTEITTGILSSQGFTIGTDAFYGKLTFSIEDVSGTDDCAFGFRKAAAYQAAIDDYTDMAVLNVISGNINIETILNDGTTQTTDTTDNWADTATHTLEVWVASDGVVTFKIDGAAPTTTTAFTFDDGDSVVPFFYFLHATDLAGAVTLKKLEVGRQ